MYKNKKIGTFGKISCFSFYPTKNLGALGDAGMICTNNKSLYLLIQKISQYGWDSKRNSMIPGLNSRMDEIQAAILRIKLQNSIETIIGDIILQNITIDISPLYP